MARKTFDIQFADTDCEMCRLDVFEPDSPNGAGIFFVHGGGWRGGKKEAWHEVMESMCEAGYLCASTNYRLAPETRFPGILADVHDGYRWFLDHAGDYGFATERVATWGSSSGGHLAAMLATIEPESGLPRPQATVLYCSMLSCRPAANPDKNMDMLKDFLGPEGIENNALVTQASPLERLDADTPPSLLVVGRDDPTTPLHWHEAWRDHLQAQGTPVHLEILPDAGHGFGYGNQTPDQKHAISLAIDFLAEQL